MTKKSKPSSAIGVRKVKWTRTALRNLDTEMDYIAEDRPEAALRMIERIRSAVSRLVDQPSLGRPGRVVGTRELVVSGTSYLIPYRVREDAIEILRVFHGARRWPDHFEPGEGK